MVTRHWCAVAARVAASVAVRASEGTIEARPIALGRQRIMTRAVTARRLNMHPVIMHMSRPVSSTQVIPSFPAAVGRTKVIPLLSHTHTTVCPSLMRGGSACGSISGGTSKRRYNRGKTNCAREAEDNDEGSDSETIEYASSYNAHESTCFHPSYPDFPAAVGRTKVIPLLSHTHTTDGCPSLMRGGSACGSISGGTSKRRYNRGNTNCAREAEDNDEGSDSETIEYASSYNAHESTCFEHPSYPELSGSSRSSQSYTTN